MSNEITVSNLGDAVREKVRLAIFSSIPDEAIDKLVENEFKKLTEQTETHQFITNDYNSEKRRVSPLQVVVIAKIKKQLQERTVKSVGEYLDLTYSTQSKELVDKAIKELAPVFMAGMMETFAQNAVQTLRNQISNKGINIY